MRRLVFLFALALASPRLAVGAAEIIDRIVAVVNGHTILLSEWDTAVRREALLNHLSLESITEASRRATFDRMVDQELLRGEMENSSVPRCTPDAIAAKLQEIRRMFPEASSDASWTALLSRYGVTQPELDAAIATELDTLRLLDFRLRSGAQPDAAQVDRYYHSVYEPAMRDKRAKPAPEAEVTPQIREILTQEKLKDLTTNWLQTLRAQGDVQINITFSEVAAEP